jgi:type III secretion protein J
MNRLALAAVAAVVAGCTSLGHDELLHGLDEAQANEVVVALDEVGIAARSAREEGPEGPFTVSVAGGDAARARRVLAERELPRLRPQGFGEIFGKSSMVPTPTEEHARYLHALAGELARSVEAIDGVVEARVHLGLPQADPLRPGEPAAPRGAVLVKCRASSCDAIRALEPGIRSLVAGAADRLEASAVAVVIAPVSAPAAAPQEPRRGRSPAVAGLAVALGVGGLALGGAALRGRVLGATRTGC